MPAGDAGLERQALSEQVQERLLMVVADTAREFLDRVTAPALAVLDKAQAAQPEGERA